MKKVLTIAGTDCSGGAGVQADIKTMTAHKVYAMSAVTALTAQNTTGVYGVLEVGTDFLARQLDCIFTDIIPDAVKIGMVSNEDNIRVITKKLKRYSAVHIVVDPVMVATSGSRLLNEGAANALIHDLIPLAEVITPNLAEAEVLCNHTIQTKEEMVEAAKSISAMLSGVVLIKGGHLDDTADDLIYKNHMATWVKGERIDNSNTHGTGCTLSSAIACNLAKGLSVEQSIRNAKRYITGALRSQLDLGKGRGPLNHCYNL